MKQPDTKASKPHSGTLLVLAFAFLALAMINANMVLLAPAFLLCGFSLHRSMDREPQRSIAIAICIALALAPVGFKLGKDMAVRDNSINSAQKAGP